MAIISRQDTKLSTINGAAFVDFGDAMLFASDIGKRSLLTIKDSAGKAITGYIKAAGTGETLGAELLTEWVNGGAGYDFETLTSSGVNITSAINSEAWGFGYNVPSAFTWGWLLKLAATLTLNSGIAPRFSTGTGAGDAGGDVNLPQTQLHSGANTLLYTIGDAAYNYLWLGNEAGQFSNFACTISQKRILTPSETGVTITSTQDGATYNWASQEAGFNYNDPAGYSYFGVEARGGNFAAFNKNLFNRFGE